MPGAQVTRPQVRKVEHKIGKLSEAIAGGLLKFSPRLPRATHCRSRARATVRSASRQPKTKQAQAEPRERAGFGDCNTPAEAGSSAIGSVVSEYRRPSEALLEARQAAAWPRERRSNTSASVRRVRSIHAVVRALRTTRPRGLFYGRGREPWRTFRLRDGWRRRV